MVKRSLATGILLGLLMITGAGCGSSEPAPAATEQAAQPVTLEYWGVFTDTDDMTVLTTAFQAKHPNIQIRYRKFRPEEYEQKLLEAFAEDRGPDLFTIHNTWFPKYKSKLSPMPDKIPYPEFVKSGSGISEKTTVVMKEATGISLKQMRDSFVQVVEMDTMARVSTTSTKVGVFALPFYMDTLAMYYNKDILAQNAIVKPALDWNQLRSHAKTITRYVKDSETITQPGIALGTGRGVHRAGDILIALMAQNGALIAKDDGGFAFHTPGNTTPARDEALPGARALRFYLDFGNPYSDAYSWNYDQGDALEAFAAGKLGYYFGYSYDMPTIKSKNPRLNFDVAALPQFEAQKPKNVSNYWMETVSNKSKYKNEAWLFIKETATDKEALAKFLKQTKRASALTALIETQKDEIDVSVFATQSLTGRTWYRGKDSAAADLILNELIDNTRARLLNPNEEYNVDELMQEAVNRAAARLNDTL